MPHSLRRGLVGLLTAGAFALVVAGAAGAAITPVANDPGGATAIANAMAATPGIVTGATFTAAPPNDSPNGTADSTLTQFPTNGSTFGILTSGSVANVDDPGLFTTVSLGGGNVRGDTDLDVSILKIDLTAPLGSNCLTFDFKFLSEEFPFYVGSQFNDAFIAELDTSNWTTSGSTITAPNNFAHDGNGDVVSVNSTGIGGMSTAQGVGTAYDGGGDGPGGTPPPGGGSAGGATVLLSASTQLTPGAHSLYLSIFDQGDRNLDSAVFLDNLVVGFVPNPSVNCVPGAHPTQFHLALTPATDTNEAGDSHTVTATLTDATAGNAPVPGATIGFSVTGANPGTGSGVTNASGQTTFTYTGTSIGGDMISACYNADSSADGSCEAVASAAKTWVFGQPAHLDLTPATATNVVGSQHCVKAKVTNQFSFPIPNVAVRFAVSGSVSISGSGTTNTSGETTFCYTGPALPGADVISAYADSNGSNTQDTGEPSDTAAKTWVLPTSTPGCKVTYGGRITAANLHKATFGGNAQAPNKGQQEYQDHGPAAAMNVHSINVQAVTCSADGTAASIFGKAKADGGGTFDYRVDLKDLGEPGSSDTYRVRLSSGYDSGEKVLESGNVQIH
jgi:Bacterial Ig-like domain (group 1)